MTTFETPSIGDRVWCVSLGWGGITDTDVGDDYPITVVFDSGRKDSFTLEGLLYSDDFQQTLFWDENVF